MDLQDKVGEVREQITVLDVKNTKITNRCEVVHQLDLYWRRIGSLGCLRYIIPF
jgi:hypothetical protein